MSDEKKDLGDKAEDAFDKAKEKAEETFDKAKEKAKEAGEKFEESTKDFREEAKKTAAEFTEGFKSASSGDNKKILAGILGIFLGWAGVHKFVMGYQKEGIILLVISVIGMITSCFIVGGFILTATWLVGVIEGIIYLTKSDEEFYNTYQVGRKPWF